MFQWSFFFDMGGVPHLKMNAWPTQHKLIQLSGVSFSMAREVLKISGGSFKKICIFRNNWGGNFQNIYGSKFWSIQRILMQFCITIEQTMSYLYNIA